ncbi:hypothetical protein [Vibrio cholerae]|uniref:hypothetical protein n=1 Tax=Vibrio cholerae TaxID=666 RepID=UPI00167B4348|nr:hypothetical protein [Vibrio cholerae]MBD1192356.1 hypothetical protein [Vibrio cholerae]
MWEGPLAPWWIEEAYKYYLVSIRTMDLGYVSDVNAALSLEILFKSFLFIEKCGEDNQPKLSFDLSRLNGNYMVKGISKGHDLYLLAKSLPDDIQEVFFQESDYEFLQRRRDTFVSSRYLYERKNRTGSSNILSNLAIEYIEKAVSLYKLRGCTDWWILNYPKI